MKTKTLTLAAALTVGLAASAHAAAVAYASLELQNFRIDVTNESSIIYGTTPRKTIASATWAGSGPSATASAAYNETSDVAQQTAGSAPFPDENTFSQFGLVNAARGDARTSGDPMSVGGTLASNVAEAQGSIPVVATAEGSNTNSATITFTLDKVGDVSISFLGLLRYYADTDLNGEIATVIAKSSFTLDGVEGTPDLANPTWTPYDVNLTASNGNTIANFEESELMSTSWTDLPAGTYTLTSDALSKAQITAVPEVTSSLALLGLFGLGLTNRRRRTIA